MSVKKSATPVENLRRIWDIKKREMDITQVEAAAKLNWTQGAFSQYLNDITEMSSQTIIKLANFLDVSPTDIDPDIASSLPNVSTKEVRFNLSDPNKEVRGHPVSWNPKQDDFVIHIDTTQALKIHGGGHAPFSKGSNIFVVDVLNSSQYVPRGSTNEPLYFIQKLNSNLFEMYVEAALPADDTLAKKFLITDITVY